KNLQEKVSDLKGKQAKFKELENKIKDVKNNIKDTEKILVVLNKDKLYLKDIIKKEQAFFEKIEKGIELELKGDKELKNYLESIKAVEEKKKILKYDSKYHKKIQENLIIILKKIKQLEMFEKDKHLQKERRVQIKLLIKQLKDLKEQIRDSKKNIKKLDFNLEAENKINKNISEIKAKFEIILKNKDKSLKECTLLEYELKRIKELKEKAKKRKKNLNILQDQLKDYQIISQAFGKNGIQALLIEQAIPQIEEESNNILSRLTDNQSQIFIESLRDLKSGGVRETLDIKISDSAGIRPYEMFSGGEAFRVDFALRIAISKLLARRAGIALQTLIIDEGFGSQDEEGLARLMDAIYTIKDDFSKVIVVSHLNSFKDNFPVHFVIQKNSSGSFINVHERG
ncbi:hypothetical protein GF385_01105, partial [Candidatus Dependentiae bacterium]|nr:hypothetical protein [Candidatus Dependentiae bacterium]